MEKYIFDERNRLWNKLHCDCCLPCLKLPEEERPPIGIWGSDTSDTTSGTKSQRNCKHRPDLQLTNCGVRKILPHCKKPLSVISG